LIEKGTSATILPQGRSSSSDDWAERAWKLFDGGHFSEAAWAFKKAKLPEDCQNARAYELREHARFSSTPNERISHYIKAAEAFYNRALSPHNVRLCTELLKASADCWELAQCSSKAAVVYLEGGFFTHAIQQFFKADDIDRAIRTAREHAEEIGADVYHMVIHKGRLSYLDKEVSRFARHRSNRV
jgi:hypothetical protein